MLSTWRQVMFRNSVPSLTGWTALWLFPLAEGIISLGDYDAVSVYVSPSTTFESTDVDQISYESHSN